MTTRAVMSGETRPNYGVTVSASRDDGRRTTIYAIGTQLSALEAVVARIDQLPGRWYIDAISTPQTVYDDINNNGRRREGDYRWFRERIYLSKIGRSDLLRVSRVWPTRDSSKPQGHGWRKKRRRR